MVHDRNTRADRSIAGRTKRPQRIDPVCCATARPSARPRPDHSATLVGGTAASFGALATVIHLVFFALDGASVTSSCAERAELDGKVTVAAHELRGQTAQRAAIEIEANAINTTPPPRKPQLYVSPAL